MTKTMTVGTLAFLLALAPFAFADDPKPAEPAEPAASEDSAKPEQPEADTAKSEDPVGDAEEEIDEATESVDEDPGGILALIIDLAKSGRWGPFAGQVLLFLVWALRKFIWKLIPKNYLSWITLGAAMVVSVAVGLVAENAWWQVLIDGLITGGSAMALWSLLFKHFMPTEKKPA